MTPAHSERLQRLIDAQKRARRAGDADAFRQHDDDFHRAIWGVCGLDNVWGNLAENKAHTDLLRLLWIRDGSAEALADDLDILAALETGDVDGAATAMRRHLDRIKGVPDDLRRTKAEWFIEDEV